MSFTNEGSGDDAARDDELDFHDDDEEQIDQTVNGHNGARPPEGDKQSSSVPDDSVSVNSSHGEDGPEQAQNGLGVGGSPGIAIQETGSLDDTGSIPDDSPSIQGSLLSSRSSAIGHRSSSSLGPSPHRPFDLRFQSRLSVSLPSGSRPISPSHLHAHSRNSSLASHIRTNTPDLLESPPSPWEVVRWTKLNKITGQVFSEIGKRNFGRPTCTAVSTSIVIGTSRGIILVFDYHQNLKTIIGPGTKAVASGSITSLAISTDHTTIAAGHTDGTIFTWEITRSGRPFLHIPPMASEQRDFVKSDGHISGAAVVHVGFLGTRRTALVSADDHGMSFSHLASRGMGAVARTIRTTRILGRYPGSTLPGGRPKKPSAVLAFSPLPLGNVEQATDSMGLVAMLTPYLLVIVSTTPVAQTQHKSARPKEVAAHSALTAAVAWFPAIKLKATDSVSKTKLAYCWSNVLTILEVSEVKPTDPHDKDRPPSFEFKPFCRWRAEEPIVAVQWISRSVLAVMTITQRLLILEDRTLRVTDSFDLIHKHIYHADLFSKQLQTIVEQLDEEDQSMHGVTGDAFYMSFKTYKGRLFLLGFNDISVGSLSNWADRLLALMEYGDFIAAIRLATSFYTGNSEKLTVGLPEEDHLRHEVVREKLLEMITASLKYAFGKNEEANTEHLQPGDLKDLADACIAACEAIGDQEYLFDEVYAWYEEYESEGIFLDVLEPYIIQGSVRVLPPTALKSLITHFATNHTATRLEEIICLLDTSTVDIDQVTSLCKQYNLYDAFIYVWNRTLNDYITPLEELLDLAASCSSAQINGNAEEEVQRRTNAMKMFPYLSYVLTGRVYPTGDELDDLESSKAKAEVYHFLFSGKGLASGAQYERGTAFQGLQTMLEFDTPSSMSMLNEAFEDSFLNEITDLVQNGGPKSADEDSLKFGLSMNRQYLISVLLDIMGSNSEFTPADTIYLDMFIARNLPKYPQYILLPGSTLQQVLVRLCKYPSVEMLDDCQLSAEYLLSSYHPPDIHSLIPLFKEARFFRILKSTYRAEKHYPELVLTYLEDPEERESVFTCIRDCLRPSSTLTRKQRREVHDVVKENAAQLSDIDVVQAAQTIQSLAADLHEVFLRALESNPGRQYQYLHAVIEPDSKTKTDDFADKFDHWLIEKYVQLMCQYEPSRVADYVDTIKAGDLQLEAVLPSMESGGIIDAAVILIARQGEVEQAMERLIKHLGTLEAGLMGILQNVEESPDSTSTMEAVTDLIQSLTKYTRVGIWLCQEQTKAAKRPRRDGKANKKGSVFQQPLTFDENLWLMLIEAVVKVARNASPLMIKGFPNGTDTTSWSGANEDHTSARLSSSFRTLVQQVFTGLLTTVTKSAHAPGDKTDVSFLRILRTFLTRAASASPSLSELRAVIASIFSAYNYEESLLSLANAMLDRDLFVHVDEVTKLRQRGWRGRGQVCEVCRRRVWGPGSGAQVWEAWEVKQAEEAKRKQDKQLEQSLDPVMASRGKGKAHAPSHSTPATTTSGATPHGFDGTNAPADENTGGSGPVVVFGCRHLYHRSCLVTDSERRRGQDQEPGPGPAESRRHHDHGAEDLACLICT